MVKAYIILCKHVVGTMEKHLTTTVPQSISLPNLKTVIKKKKALSLLASVSIMIPSKTQRLAPAARICIVLLTRGCDLRSSAARTAPR